MGEPLGTTQHMRAISFLLLLSSLRVAGAQNRTVILLGEQKTRAFPHGHFYDGRLVFRMRSEASSATLSAFLPT